MDKNNGPYVNIWKLYLLLYLNCSVERLWRPSTPSGWQLPLIYMHAKLIRANGYWGVSEKKKRILSLGKFLIYTYVIVIVNTIVISWGFPK